MPSGRLKSRNWRNGSSSSFAAAPRAASLDDIGTAEWVPMRELLEDLSRDRADPGLQPERDRHLRLLAEGAAVRAAAPGARRGRRTARQGDLDRQQPDRSARPLHHRMLRADPRGGDHPPAAGTAGTLDAGGRAVGRHPGAAADRHARQRAHADRHGEPAAAHRHLGGGDRHHRHHRRADRRYAGRAAPDQDHLGRAADGRRLHPQRHSPADRADHRASRPRTERRVQGHHGRCARARPSALRPGGHGPQTARRRRTHSRWPKSPS